MNKILPVILLLFLFCNHNMAADTEQPGAEAYAKAMVLLEKEDLAGALPLLTEAAKAGHPDAMVQMVYVLPDLDKKTKVDLLHKAAEKGNAFAQFNLGNFCLLFIGSGSNENFIPQIPRTRKTAYHIEKSKNLSYNSNCLPVCQVQNDSFL